MTAIPPASRKALRAALARSTPAGEEGSALSNAEAELHAAQAAVRALRASRARIERAVSVRERKLADWKGKIPFCGTPDAHSAHLTLARAGAMPVTFIGELVASAADGCASTLVIRPGFRRALRGLGGFSHVWVVCVSAGVLRAHVQAVGVVDARAGTLALRGAVVADVAAVADIKPYLGYCDAR